jgi:hypothetical protein
MGLYTTGIAAIKMGNVAVDGGPGATLAQLGLTVEGTGKLNQADPDRTDFRVEEQDQPVFSVITPGAITYDFSIANPDVDTCIALFGGTASGTSPNRIWNMPDTIPTLNQTVRIEPRNGIKAIVIPNGQVVAKLNGSTSRTELFAIDVTVTALSSTKTGVGPIQFVV